LLRRKADSMAPGSRGVEGTAAPPGGEMVKPREGVIFSTSLFLMTN
jgi:hypothetical protein